MMIFVEMNVDCLEEPIGEFWAILKENVFDIASIIFMWHIDWAN